MVADGDIEVVTRIETFERLPATPENLARLSVREQHPDAVIVPGGITVNNEPDPGSAKQKAHRSAPRDADGAPRSGRRLRRATTR